MSHEDGAHDAFYGMNFGAFFEGGDHALNDLGLLGANAAGALRDRIPLIDLLTYLTEAVDCSFPLACENICIDTRACICVCAQSSLSPRSDHHSCLFVPPPASFPHLTRQFAATRSRC